MALVQPRVPYACPDHQTTAAEPQMQQMQHGAQHNHIAEPPEGKYDRLQRAYFGGIESRRRGRRTSAASGAGQLKCLILLGHGPDREEGTEAGRLA
jgi:hypothetical protein